MDAYALAARLDYGLLKRAARLPRPLALLCCAFRALLRFSFDLEWRSYALKRRYVRLASAQAYAQLQAKPSKGVAGRLVARLQRTAWVLGRFWVESVEEFDVIRLDTQGLKACACTVHGLAGLEGLVGLEEIGGFAPAGERNQGVVLLTAHFESLYLPLCHLAARGRAIYLAASQIVEDPQVPCPIRAHFQRKKEALERHLGKGHVVYVEQGMPRLARALQAGAIVVIACDSPAPETSRGFRVGFLGQSIMMAQGPRWLALHGQAQVALMTVKRWGFWHYQLDIHGPYVGLHPQPGSDGRAEQNLDGVLGDATLRGAVDAAVDGEVDAALQAAYLSLDAVIRKSPWRWWAADLVLRRDSPESEA